MKKSEILKKIKILLENHEKFLENNLKDTKRFLDYHSTDYFVLWKDTTEEVHRFIESNIKILEELNERI